MDATRTPRLTPWVTRLMILNGAMFVLFATVFTAPRFVAALQFDPSNLAKRPWTALTYLFVHGNIVQFALNAVALVVFGPPVERKLGSQRFLGFYMYCGIGAALFALAVSTILRIDPFVGASGAMYGVMLAFVVYWPEAQLSFTALPISLSARVVFLSLLIVDGVFGILGRSEIAHFAHLGGALAGYVFVRLQIFTTRRPMPRPPAVSRRPVVTPMRVQEGVTELRPAMPAAELRSEAGPDEMDRVLDKIAQLGIDSLTNQERKFLTEVAEKKKREQN